MAVPTRRRGHSKQGQVRQNTALKPVNTVTCSNCGAAIKPHHVCPNCGFYNGKKVKEVKEAE
ncbi:MAG: 50S ribosomal protein L32 [Bacilli bacterium]|nr:50S ribosomal protein L32 [Bacilli bacterium]